MNSQGEKGEVLKKNLFLAVPVEEEDEQDNDAPTLVDFFEGEEDSDLETRENEDEDENEDEAEDSANPADQSIVISDEEAASSTNEARVEDSTGAEIVISDDEVANTCSEGSEVHDSDCSDVESCASKQDTESICSDAEKAVIELDQDEDEMEEARKNTASGEVSDDGDAAEKDQAEAKVLQKNNS